MIQEIVEYSETKFDGKKLTFSITSNGTLLNDEIIEYFIAHNVNLMISLDGPKNIHDKCRVFAQNGQGTFDTVFSELVHIFDKYSEYSEKIMISMVMDPSNDFDEINSIFKSHDLFSKINFISTIVDDASSNQKNIFSEKYIAKYEYNKFLAVLSHFNRFEEKGVSRISIKSLYTTIEDINKITKTVKLNYTDAPSGPCIPGGRRLFVTVDGRLLPCERVSETCAFLNIGDISKGIDIEKAKSILNIGSLTIDECKNCWAFRHCNLCARHAIHENFLSKETKLENCKISKKSALGKLKISILLNEISLYYKNNIYLDKRM